MEIVNLKDGILETRYYPEKIYSGFITATGTGGNNKLPLGWSVIKPMEGRYKIVHNLDLGSNKDLRVTATLFGNPPDADKIYVKNVTPNLFIIETASKNKLTSSAFFFTAILI